MKVAVIGGGPAGMMACIIASKNKNEVTLFEQNEKLGKKLFITGKGRCNVTNACDKNEFFKNVITNDKFFMSSYNDFSNIDLMNFLSDNGCPIKVERGNRVFPKDDKSFSVTDCFKRQLKKYNVNIKLNTKLVGLIIKIGDKIEEIYFDKINDNKKNIKNNLLNISIDGIIVNDLIAKKNIKEKFDKVIIATGGASYKSTGSTGDGYKIANMLNINVKKIVPALVPIEVDDDDLSLVKEMQGLSLTNVKIKIYDNEKHKFVFEDFGEMLFTHFGFSGPIILTASSKITNYDNLQLFIDLKPAVDYNTIDNRLLREFNKDKKKSLKNILNNLIPKSMVNVFIKKLVKILKSKNIVLNYEEISKLNASNISLEIRNSIVFLLKNFDFKLKCQRSFDEAIVTKGGIDCKELNPKTMETKKIKGLYFAGEVIDIDCLTGGFNITVAVSTGYKAGNFI